MTTEPASPERLSEVLRLCTLLADRVLDAKIMDRLVPAEQAVALAKAARLLQDHGVDWPPLLTQVLHELASDAPALSPQEPDPSRALAEAVSQSLSRFFASPKLGID